MNSFASATLAFRFSFVSFLSQGSPFCWLLASNVQLSACDWQPGIATGRPARKQMEPVSSPGPKGVVQLVAPGSSMLLFCLLKQNNVYKGTHASSFLPFGVVLLPLSTSLFLYPVDSGALP